MCQELTPFPLQICHQFWSRSSKKKESVNNFKNQIRFSRCKIFVSLIWKFEIKNHYFSNHKHIFIEITMETEFL